MLANLFGSSILADAIDHRRGLAAELDDFRVPWRVIRRYVAGGRPRLRTDLDEMLRGNGAGMRR
jgi:hypothetical protein